MAETLKEKMVLGLAAVVIGVGIGSACKLSEKNKKLKEIKVNNTVISETCSYSIYPKDGRYLKTCTSTPALDCDSDFQNTYSSTTSGDKLQKFKDGYRKACSLSSNPSDDALLKLIERERNKTFNNFYYCENWSCFPVEKKYKNEKVVCGEAEVTNCWSGWLK